MDPRHLITTHSRVLAERLSQHPDWGARLERDPYRTAAKPRAQLERECTAWCDDAGDLTTGLRWCKYYELARMAWRDWNEHAAIRDTLQDWSTVADVLVAHAFHAVATPLQIESACTLIALGKLGAEELNISSDVDLLLLHDDTRSIADRVPALTQRLTAMLQQSTADGFVFRVDWDLRPEGERGPLACSLPGALHHYETRGAEWERMMLIRARPIAGNHALGTTLCAALRPFVYPRHTSTTLVQSLYALKQQLERTQASVPFHVKTGRGGIREIEFVVQALQLLHGGREPALRTHSTWRAMDAIADHRLLPRARIDSLRAAYGFFRRVENMLQIDGDQQRHSLPETVAEMQRLVSKMSNATAMPDADALVHFTQTVEQHRTQVHEAFRRIFAVPYEKIELLENVEANLAPCTSIEEEIDALSWSKRSALKAILADDIGGKRPFDHSSRRITYVADVIVADIQRIALQQCTARFGVPRTATGAAIPFTIVALGNCGALAMDYGSDLDLLFVYGGTGQTSGPHVITATEFFCRLGQKIIALLNVRHRYGPLYPVDLELRPAGQFGVLVTTDEAFGQYHRDDSAVWERQAMLRARVIAGDGPYSDRLTTLLTEIPFGVPHQRTTDAEIASSRGRMETELAHEDARHLDLKYGPGGIADVEFLIQAVQLRHGTALPTLRCTNPWDAIKACQAAQVLAPETTTGLAAHYSLLRRTLAHARLLTNSRTTRLDVQSDTFGQLVEVLGLASTTPAAVKKIHDARHWIRGRFTEYFGV